ncbi:MAG: carboxypeptidase-like regulatory domain-containing protein [Gemmatimonadales bacterium]|nr:carboxypeptidase-like regulatory domain-containing protein [Gemmatimonadales bacterium]
MPSGCPGGRANGNGRWTMSRPGLRVCSRPPRRTWRGHRMRRRSGMRRIFTVAVLALPAAPAEMIGQGGLDVSVRDAETGAGLPRAQVSLPGLGYGGIANFEGRFHIANLPAGTVSVEVRLIGYAIASREATVVDDSVVVFEILLKPSLT